MSHELEDTAIGGPESATAAPADTLIGDPENTAGPPGDTLIAPTEDLPRGLGIGRYILLDRLGAGAMGVVYAAFDPDLDRKVALKLLRPRSGSGSEVRLLREAQALAKLAHPNVVTIHDVGTHVDRVWIAMEFVAGQSLDAWARAKPRRWPELLRALQDAARGVAAAHAAGLVHRDLKPENVMVDRDDRVRVMDFGLAHGRLATILPPEPHDPRDPRGPTREDPTILSARLTQAGAVTGTPAYMAPEQWEGREAEAAADQFGWSVMAWELLHGERPYAGDNLLKLGAAVLAGRRRPPPRGRGVPRWLQRVLIRGLASAPEQRFPDMAALLAALGRARARARLRLLGLVLAILAALALVALLARHVDHNQRLAACDAAGATIDELWNDDARARLRAAFLATGQPEAPATLATLLPWYDRQAAAWSSARAQVCRHADVDRDWDPDTLDRADWCLEHRRLSFAAEIHEIADADPTAVQRSVSDAARLAVHDRCTDRAWLHEQPPPPRDDRHAVMAARAEVSRAESLMLAGKYDQAVTVAAAARTRAEALAWPPLVANAHFAEGLALAATGQSAAAEVALSAAYFAAARDSTWSLASDAASNLIYVVGAELVRPAEARVWFRHAEVAAAHIGDPTGLIEAARLGELAAVLDVAGAYAEAIDLYRRCLAVREQHLGPDDLEVALTLNNIGSLALVLDDFAGARAVLERSAAIYTRGLGPDHPDLARVLGNLGAALVGLGDYAAAQQTCARALAIREHALGPDHPAVAYSLGSLALADYHAGDLATAHALLTRALALRERSLGATHPLVATTLVDLALIDRALEDPAAARQRLERALAIAEPALGPDHPDLAPILLTLASVLDDPAAARPLVDRARTILERSLGGEHIRLAEVHRELATLDLRSGDTRRAREHAELALRLRERALGPDHPELAAVLADLAAIDLADHHPDHALPRLERALAIYTAAPGDQPGERTAKALRVTAQRAIDAP